MWAEPFGSSGYDGGTLNRDGSFHWTPTDLDLNGTLEDGTSVHDCVEIVD